MSLAIVIGSEGQGIEVGDKCDFTLKYLWLDMLIVSMLLWQKA